MIFKPSEQTPIGVSKIAELLKLSGLPDGVFNVINGDKRIVEAICKSEDVSAVSFVGSTKIAKLVYQLSTQNLKRCIALGGAKNHLIEERIFLKTLMGGCTSPIGAYAEINKNAISLKGSVLSLDGMKSITKELKREYNNSDIGVDLAYFILNNGGDEILANTRSK